MTSAASSTTERVAAPSVAICALTFKRPHGLRRLLDGIAQLEFADAAPASLSVVIVDNDPEGSGQAVVEEMRPHVPWPLLYAVEPRRGIPYGRNRALEEAGDVDFVAFIDDDEAPRPAWLDELLAAQRVHDAGIVTGPVHPVFEETPPEWAVRGRFFERRAHADGERLHYARTSNVLVDAEVYRELPEPFPTSFQLNGGDDTFFFKRAHLGGERIVWAQRAEVDEWVPASRVDRAWIARRGYRNGASLSLCLKMLEDSPGRRLKRLAAGVVRMGQGLGLMAAGLVRGRHVRIRGVQQIAYGAGLIGGLAGHSPQEYRVTHGS